MIRKLIILLLIMILRAWDGQNLVSYQSSVAAANFIIKELKGLLHVHHIYDIYIHTYIYIYVNKLILVPDMQLMLECNGVLRLLIP